MEHHRLVIPEDIWKELIDYVLQDSDEHLAFLQVGYAKHGNGARLMALSLVKVPDSALHSGSHVLGLSLSLDALIEIMNDARRAGRFLVEVHSHPFSTKGVQFSQTDLEGQAELYEYLVDVYGDIVYGALVAGSESVDGLVWRGEDDPTPIDEIVVLGDTISTFVTTSGTRTAPEIVRLHDRQVLALGEEGQRLLASARVAVVGVGGIGSLVVQQLAHLGVGAIALIDGDTVEETNLNRLAGATADDIGRLKVTVLADLALRVNPRLRITEIASELRDPAALAAAVEADVLFGCVDTDSGRLIMNELALAHYIPYIDIGVGIEANEGRIQDAGGRVLVWLPNRPCLLCANEIDTRVAAEELENEQQRAFRREHGYVAGQYVPEPSVMSLNATLASLAVTSFLGLLTGVMAAPFYTYYDFLEQKVGHRVVSRDPRCIPCSARGLGDKVHIERYS